MVATADGVTGGASVPLTLDPAGLPADVRQAFPHLAVRGAAGAADADVAAMLTARSRSPRSTHRGGWSTPPACRSPACSTTLRRGPEREARPDLARRPADARALGADRQERRSACSDTPGPSRSGESP